MYYCYNCGQYHYAGFNCPALQQPLGYVETKFNYECPDCHGRFNYPSYKTQGTNAFGTQHCPFCDKQMKGL